MNGYATLSALIFDSAGFEWLFEMSCPPDGRDDELEAALAKAGSTSATAPSATTPYVTQRRRRSCPVKKELMKLCPPFSPRAP